MNSLQKKKPRKIVVVASILSIIIFLAIMEGCAYLSYLLIFKAQYAATEIITLQKSLTMAQADTLTASNKSDCVVHPYYGYAHNDNYRSNLPPRYEMESAAELGFYSTQSLTPFDRDRRFFVAITGGSVAHLFAGQTANVLRDFVRTLPEAQDKDVVLFDLANWAYKQPQQLIILADLLHRGARFDLVINIDGFNELVLAHGNAQAGVSPFFPSQWQTAAAGMPSRAALEAYGKAAILQRWRMALARHFRSWPHDPLLGLTWRLLDVTVAQKIVALRTRMNSAFQSHPGDVVRLSNNGKIMLGPNRKIAPASFTDQAAAAWARASALMADLVSASGGRYMHVLQPNQYVPESKALTPQEKNDAYLPDGPTRSLVVQGYPLLRKAGRLLRQDGIDFLDMTMVFHDAPETLYEDTCCHFNKKGNLLLAEAIGRALRDAPPSRTSCSLVTLDSQLRAYGLFDHTRLAQEATLDIDLVQTVNTPRLRLSGLADIEGATGARWRWGLGPETRIAFPLPAALPVTLRYALASPFEDQDITVVFNGRTMDHQTVPTKTSQLLAPQPTLERSITLPGQPGKNILELRYRLANGPGHVLSPGESRALAVIYRQLRLRMGQLGEQAQSDNAPPATQPGQ